MPANLLLTNVQPQLNAPYQFATPINVKNKLSAYFKQCTHDPTVMSNNLKKNVNAVGGLAGMELNDFLLCIISLRKSSDTRDINEQELDILARVGTVFNTRVFEGDFHGNTSMSQPEPIPYLMGYVSPPSLDDPVPSYNVFKERVLPTLHLMNQQAKTQGKRLRVTVYGKNFARPLLVTMLTQWVNQLDAIDSVYLVDDEHHIANGEVSYSDEIQGQSGHRISFACGRRSMKPTCVHVPSQAEAILIDADPCSYMGNGILVDSNVCKVETRQLKDFVKEQLKVHQEGEARFFSDFYGEFTVGAHNLLSASDEILLSIGDGQPNIEKVKKFFGLVDSALESIFNEIIKENADQTQAIKAQNANIKSSMAFKLSSFSLREKTDKGSFLLLGQSPVLVRLADEFFVKGNSNLASVLELFYEAKLKRAIDSLKSVVLKADSAKILSELDLTKIVLDSEFNFYTLPATYRQKISTALWEYYSFKKNPYPFSLGGHDDSVISELSKISLTTVESMADTITNRKVFETVEIEWMHKTPVSDVLMGPNYKDESSDNFNLSTISDNTRVGLIVSGRPPTKSELRGEILRNMITKAKQLPGNIQSVYGALQAHLRTLELNTNYLMLESLITTGLLSQQQDFISDFDNTSPVYQAVKVEVLKRLLIFAKEYSRDAANFDVKFIENGKLTTIGKNKCEAILIEINNLNPLPDNLLSDLNAIKLCKQRMVTLSAQLEKGNPIKLSSPEYNALQTLHESLCNAHAALQGDIAVDAISHFETACCEADSAYNAPIEVAKNSALLNHPDGLTSSTLPPTNPLVPETTHQSHTTKRNWKKIGGIVGGIIGVVVGAALIATGFGILFGVPLVAYAIATLVGGALLGSALGATVEFVSKKRAKNKINTQLPTEKVSPPHTSTSFKSTYAWLSSQLVHDKPSASRAPQEAPAAAHTGEVGATASENLSDKGSSVSSLRPTK